MADIQHSDVTSIHRFAYVGTSSPGAVGAYKAWVDTSFTPPRLKMRNIGNTDWVDIGIYDIDLTAIANLSPSNDDILQRKGGTWTNRTPAQLKVDLNLVPGTNIQPYDVELTALASLSSSANKLPYFTGAGTAATTTMTALARNLLDDNTTSDMRITLGLGTMALQDSNNVFIFSGTLEDIGFLGLRDNGTGWSTQIQSDGTGQSDARVLTLDTMDADRLIRMSGDLFVTSTATISGTNTGNELPSQIGMSGKVLTSNGTIQSWGDGVMYGASVANSAARLALTSKPRFYHVIQSDNGIVYVLLDETDISSDKAWLPLAKGGQRVFRALLTQTGTATPTMTILENGLQGTPAWSRTGPGDYTLSLTGSFAIAPTIKFFSTGGVWYNDGTDIIAYSLIRIDDDNAKLRVTRLSPATAAMTELSTVVSTYTGNNPVPLEFYVY